MALLLLSCLGVNTSLHAQNARKATVSGVVHEYDTDGKRIPLGYASLYFPDFGIGTTTDENGRFRLENIPDGEAKLQVQYIGKLTIDTLLQVKHDLNLDLTLQNEDFKLTEVIVTAKSNQTGRSTSSSISRQAMDHMQATSLHDLLALMPGGTVSEPNLNSNQQINIRQVSGASSGEEALNALGTSIIRDWGTGIEQLEPLCHEPHGGRQRIRHGGRRFSFGRGGCAKHLD